MAGFKSKKPRTGFDRPQASAGTEVNREWREVYPSELGEGDILPGAGAVIAVLPFADCRGEIMVEAGTPHSKDYFLPEDVKVKAFVRKVS